LRDVANAEWKLELSEEQIGQFVAYAKMLVDWNQKFNLTRLTSPEQVADGHFLDSLAVLQAVKLRKGGHVIDVGTGAGLPGIALKIARPDLMITLLDSTKKKLLFCDEVISTLRLDGIRTLHGRAEEVAREPKHNGSYEFVTARAVAPLDRLLGWCAPFVNVGGLIIAFKGSSVNAELTDGVPAARRLRLNLGKPIPINIPGSDAQGGRFIVTARRDTPLSPLSSRLPPGGREPGRR
jgi:16S rRNA (guanine527-N7)-methyltransferase